MEIFISSAIIKASFPCYLKVVGLLGEKFDFFISLGIQIEIDFIPINTRIKLHLFRALKWYLMTKVWSMV